MNLKANADHSKRNNHCSRAVACIYPSRIGLHFAGDRPVIIYRSVRPTYWAESYKANAARKRRAANRVLPE